MRIFRIKGQAIWRAGKEKVSVDLDYTVSVRQSEDARNAIFAAHSLAEKSARPGPGAKWVDFDARSVKLVTDTDN